MKKNQILLVEDNEGDIVLTSEAFEECGCKTNIQVARNGKEAINILFDQSDDAQLPDLILLDINLPLLNGHEVLKKIKENEKTQYIPVVILTTSSAISDINLTYENFANSFITKPADINDFFETINSLSNYWFNICKLPAKK
ncbi:response regulator [Flavobacterium proteolyticum]|uniref:Response regulator n=1 Tax=Flavobacterium proteolyticum TaxID=2911683 RepID=A0ABR9WR63_9FLAO|nr:response regulator [Flavobacterium proteolyticum]MBE9576409.1 response regulator [Flavobacterium proteolyticum]